MVTFNQFEKNLCDGEFDTLATALIDDSKGCTEAQIHSNLGCFDNIQVLHDWDQSSTLASPFKILDFRSLKERLSEALYFAANYAKLEKMSKESGITLERSHDFYVDSVKACLKTLVAC